MTCMVGIYFALCCGAEHRQLRHPPSQIQLIEKLGKRPYLLYTEDHSKSDLDELKGRKVQIKDCTQH